jgi:hypothetical protein
MALCRVSSGVVAIRSNHWQLIGPLLKSYAGRILIYGPGVRWSAVNLDRDLRYSAKRQRGIILERPGREYLSYLVRDR